MNKGIMAALGVAGILVLGVTGCDKSTPPPPSATSGTGASGNGNPINKLAENPNSLLGKSAATARDAARKASSAQDAAVGTAQEISGEASALSVSGLIWSAPTTWEKTTPSSSMRAAEYKVKAEGGGGEATVAFFANIQGDAASNIERWRTQFADAGGGPPEATIKQQTIAGCKVWLASLKGTYKGGSMGGPTADMPNAALRGVIIDGPQGMVFIKFTGPEATITENEAAWNTMVNGMRKQ
jgi:hypothetical protein